ncbi:hypothetical protein [Nonomuraea sp. NPDC001831]|uniref:hypothetical protein n=1 Tax=Nonomuraea sp. NPDC001831 TaxID=3364340 RepID=UPI0036A969A9
MDTAPRANRPLDRWEAPSGRPPDGETSARLPFAYADTAFADTAFADTAFADTAFADTAFADTAFADTAFADTAFAANCVQRSACAFS